MHINSFALLIHMSETSWLVVSGFWMLNNSIVQHQGEWIETHGFYLCQKCELQEYYWRWSLCPFGSDVSVGMSEWGSQTLFSLVCSACFIANQHYQCERCQRPVVVIITWQLWIVVVTTDCIVCSTRGWELTRLQKAFWLWRIVHCERLLTFFLSLRLQTPKVAPNAPISPWLEHAKQVPKHLKIWVLSGEVHGLVNMRLEFWSKNVLDWCKCLKPVYLWGSAKSHAVEEVWYQLHCETYTK